MIKGKWEENEEIETINEQLITSLQEQETYKYLGFHQNTKLQHKNIKQQITQKYKARITSILKSKLNSKHIVKAINTYAIPLLTYSFGVIKWSNTETEELNRLNRTMLTKYRMHHPKSCIQRMTLPRAQGGRGLIDITQLHKTQINNLRQYFHNKQDSSLHKAINTSDTNITPLNLSQQQEPEQQDINNNDETHTTDKATKWSQKTLHGRHYNIIQQPHINKLYSYAWLTKGELQPETEGFTIAIQDQVIATKNYIKHILKDPNTHDDKCKRYHQFPETIDHITSGCKLLASTEYTDRHNTVAKIIHQEIALKHRLITEHTPYYKYHPQTILENNHVKLYWDTTLHTDRTVAHNRPDITLTLKKDKVTYFIDIAIPNDTNIKTKELEKIDKYTPLAIDIKQTWKQNKIIILSFIMSPTGVTPFSFIQNLHKLNIHTRIHTTIQKAVILKTCHLVRKFLNPPQQ